MSLASYVLKRTIVSLFMLLIVSVIVFLIVRLVPGDPAKIVLGEFATEENIRAYRRQMGLHLPIWEQYVNWLSGVLTGDFGESLVSQQPVRGQVETRLPRSLQLALMGTVLSIAIGIPLGTLAAINYQSKIDDFTIVFSQLGVSIPSFWFGLLLALVFGRYLQVLPAFGYVPPSEGIIENLKHTILPATTIGIIYAAPIARFVRTETVEEISREYVRTEKSLGIPNRKIVRKYILKNSLTPALTMIGIQFGNMIGGLVVIEYVFAYPGLGRLLINSLSSRDYPTIQISILVLAAVFILANLVVDILYGYLDPKVAY